MQLWIIVSLTMLTALDDVRNSADTSAYQCTGLYIVSINVNETSILALVDTGCATCCFDSQFYHQSLEASVTPLRQERVILSNGKSIDSPVFTIPMQINSGMRSTVLSTTVDLQTISKSTGFDFKAIVGMSYLDDHPVRFHGANGTAEQVRNPKLLPQGSSLELRTRKTRPVMGVSLPLIGARDFLIDTGMTGAIAMEANRLEQLERAGFAIRLSEQGREVYGADGSRSAVETYWLRRIDINGLRFENLLATTAKESIIGMGILRHFDITIDCRNKQLWIEPLPGSDRASFAPGGTGFYFKFDAERHLFVQESMRPEGPAEVAGIKPGDEIIEIDGDPVEKYTFYSVTDRFSEAGTNLHLKCRRDGKEFEVDLVLKHRYQYPPEWPPVRKPGTQHYWRYANQGHSIIV